jgi:enamine deaminase RidA (YjgF/YER057c/UK114 family)
MQFRHARRILESQGSSLSWQLRQNGWLNIPMREFGPVSRVRRRLFSGSNTGPFTSLRVSGTRNGEAAFEYSVLALIPPEGPDDHRRDSVMSPHGIASYYIGAVKSGPYVIAAGEVPVDTTVPGAIGGFADLRDAGRFLGIGRLHEDKPILAKAWFVYQKLKECMKGYGSSMENVVSQRVFMAQPADYPALERIATLFYGPQLPPTTVVPILDTSPYPEAGLEIEVISLTR